MAATRHRLHPQFKAIRLAVIHAVFVSFMLLGWAVLVSEASAAEPWEALAGTVFQNYGPDQGLPPVVPTALAQDGDGFLWIGTQSGLVRWDGYRFRVYDAAIDSSAHGLPQGWIETVHTDAAGELWIGMESAGLVRYDRDSDRFVPTPVGRGGSASHRIGAIEDDGGGGLWIGTDAGLYRIRSTGPPGSMARGVDQGSSLLPGVRINALMRDRDGRLWIGTDKGLARLDPGARGANPMGMPMSAHEVIHVSVLFQDADGRIWIGTERHGLYVIDPGEQVVKPFQEQDSEGWSPRINRITAIVAAGNHDIWVGMRAAGVFEVNTATRQIRRIRHDQLVPSSLAHNDVWTMLKDRSGAIWIGGAAGVSYHPRDSGTVRGVFGDTRQANGISEPDISTVLSASDGRIWLGFLDGGADIIDPLSGRVAGVRPDDSHPAAALPPDVTTSIVEAGDGHFYIGTARGLYRANRNGRGVALTHLAGRDPLGYVRTLMVQGSTLWIGGPDGLWRMPIAAGGPPARKPSDFSRLSNPSVFTLLAGARDELWIGTEDGLNRLDLASGDIEIIPAEPKVPTALPAGIIASLVRDRLGRLWVGTFGGGIAVMTGRDGAGHPQFRRIGVAEGLPNLNVDKLLLDRAGLIWASTDGGLAVIDPSNVKVQAIQRADSAGLTIFWDASGATDHLGEPLFGAQGGLAVIRPGWPPAWNLQAPVVVSDIRVAGKFVAAGRFNGVGSKDPVVLTTRTDSLAVEFSLLDFAGPEQNSYAYRLRGFDENWTETDAAHRIAAYTNLPPGHYILELRGSNRAGVWNPAITRIPIHVLAAWYQTLWAKLIAAVVVIAAALGVFAVVDRRRTANLRWRQAELEREIAIRTADLRAANALLSELATTDPLTGCANRRHFMERALSLFELGRRTTPVSLAILDLDHFKLINDQHGHPVGDEVLRMVGQTLLDQVRVSDLVGRIGGEEFAVFMPDTLSANAILVLDRLRAALAETEVRVGGLVIRTTVSLGLAEQRPDEDFATLYARADAALYEAKEGGRDRVVVGSAPGASGPTS